MNNKTVRQYLVENIHEQTDILKKDKLSERGKGYHSGILESYSRVYNFLGYYDNNEKP